MNNKNGVIRVVPFLCSCHRLSRDRRHNSSRKFSLPLRSWRTCNERPQARKIDCAETTLADFSRHSAQVQLAVEQYPDTIDPATLLGIKIITTNRPKGFDRWPTCIPVVFDFTLFIFELEKRHSLNRVNEDATRTSTISRRIS